MELIKKWFNYWKFPICIVICILLFFNGLSYSFYPLLISFFCAYLALPLINRLERKGLSRSFTTIGILLIFLIFVVLLVLFLVPFLIKEIEMFSRALPDTLDQTSKFVNDQMEKWGFSFRLQLDHILSRASLTHLVDNVSKAEALTLSNAITSAFSNILQFIIAFLTVCLMPVFFYYCVDKYESIVGEFKRYLPQRYIDLIQEFLEVVQNAFGRFFRGQLIVSIILACLYAVGLHFVGLKFGILIGISTGLLGMIPYFGHGMGILTSLVSLLLHGSGPGVFIGVIIVFAVLIVIEGYVLTPKIVGGKVGLNAFVTLLALIVFGEYLDFLGILIAIPSTCVLKFYYERFLMAYGKTPFFKGEKV